MTTPTISLPSLPSIPRHITTLLDRLHAESLAQETTIAPACLPLGSNADLLRDKFIALDRAKAHFVYTLCRATNARTIVEAGTSFGVSTIYLALAAAANARSGGAPARVIATEHEPSKAARARQYWDECGDAVSGVIELREGDLRETLKRDTGEIDLLLLDIWTPMAAVTLKLLQPRLRNGAVVVADATAEYADDYQEFLSYIRAPGSGYITLTLPYQGGLEMSVYTRQD